MAQGGVSPGLGTSGLEPYSTESKPHFCGPVEAKVRSVPPVVRNPRKGSRAPRTQK